MYKIKTQGKLGMNGACYACGKLQDGWKTQPIALWYKAADETRGHDAPFCCVKCAEAYIKANNIE